MSAIRFAPFLAQTCKPSMELLSTARVNLEQSHLHMGNGSAVAGTVLSSSTEFGNPKPVDQTKQKSPKLTESVYRDGTPFFVFCYFTLLHAVDIHLYSYTL